MLNIVTRQAGRAISALDEDVGFKVRILQFPEDTARWNLVGEYMSLRRRIFIERKDWSLWHAEDMEFEQYDTFDTTYVIAHDHHQVIGGGRLRRADQRIGSGSYQYSYMIRDAVLGMLPGLPDNLCFETPPTDAATWELTRFVSEGSPRVASAMLRAINDFLFYCQGKSCLCLGTPAFLRMARRIGWPASPLGPVCGNKDGRFLVFDLPVADPSALPETGLTTGVS